MLSLIIITFSSCISNKKHLEAVNTLEGNFQQQVSMLRQTIDSLSSEKNQLTLNLARKQGENNALLTVQDRLQDRIDILQGQIESLRDLAVDEQNNLSSELEKRESALMQKQEQIKALQDFFLVNEAVVQKIASSLKTNLSVEDSLGLVTFKIGYDQLNISIKQSALFESRRPTNLKGKGRDLLYEIGQILEKYPAQYLTIIGHTSNKAPRSKAYKDNWDLSALLSAAIGRYFIDDYGINANQVVVSAKGEYAPLQSNQTPEGQTLNQRIELIISQGERNQLRNLKKNIDNAVSGN